MIWEVADLALLLVRSKLLSVGEQEPQRRREASHRTQREGWKHHSVCLKCQVQLLGDGKSSR